MSNEYKSAWVKLGEELLQGKKIEEITLRGKKYKFSYTEEEYRDIATKSGWKEEYIDLGWKLYKDQQSNFICDLKSDFCLNNGGFGCLAGESKIYNADTREYERIDDLVCLCEPCHKELHIIYTIKRDIRKETQRFINAKQELIRKTLKTLDTK